MDEMSKEEKLAMDSMKGVEKPSSLSSSGQGSTSSSTSSPSSGQSPEDSSVCCVCLSNEKNILLRPCRSVTAIFLLSKSHRLWLRSVSPTCHSYYTGVAFVHFVCVFFCVLRMHFCLLCVCFSCTQYN